MSEENNLSLMLMMARSVLLYNRVPKLEEIFNMIDATDALKLQDVAQDIFDEKKLSFLTMIPESEKAKANVKKKV
jgi:hypothetical protein